MSVTNRLGLWRGALAAAIVVGVSAATSSAATLASWTFETSTPITAGPHAAEVGTGGALGVHASASSVYSNPSGNGTTESFSSNFWSVGDYYQFSTAATGLANYSLTWDQTSSGTGPRDFALQYSTDGSTYLPISTISVLANADPNPLWNVTTSSPIYTNSGSVLATATGTIYFRVANSSTVSAAGGVVGTGGTSRVDNVTIASTAIPEPATLVLAGVGLIGATLLRRRDA